MMGEQVERIPRYRADERLPDDAVCMAYDVVQVEQALEAQRKALQNKTSENERLRQDRELNDH